MESFEKWWKIERQDCRDCGDDGRAFSLRAWDAAVSVERNAIAQEALELGGAITVGAILSRSNVVVEQPANGKRKQRRMSMSTPETETQRAVGGSELSGGLGLPSTTSLNPTPTFPSINFWKMLISLTVVEFLFKVPYYLVLLGATYLKLVYRRLENRYLLSKHRRQLKLFEQIKQVNHCNTPLVNPNVQIEGQPAVGLSRSNAGLGVSADHEERTME